MCGGMAKAQRATESLLASDLDERYTRETVFGVNLNTNAGLIGGAMFKHGRLMSGRNYHHFHLEIVNVKHPKEQTRQNLVTGQRFIQGKVNHFVVIRPMYGVERILFKKARQQGVQVNAVLAAGPALGIVAPYLINYQGRIVRYDPSIHRYDGINGSATIFQALPQASLEVGASTKLSLNFEMGAFKSSVAGFETGIMADFYRQPIVIVNDAQNLVENRSIFTSFFINFYFGSKK